MSAPELTSLLWADILFKKVFPRLTMTDLFNLRAASRKCREMVEAYFVEMPVLSLSPYAHKFPRHHFAVLARCCSNLREVKLAGCDFLTTSLLSELFSRNHKITTLILDKTTNLESSCLQHVIIDCKNLKVLRLSECVWVTVGCLDALTLHHQSLEEVDLSYCTAVSSHHSLNFFLSKLPKLRSLRLGGLLCLDSTLSMVLTFCRELEMLDLSHGQSSSERVKELIEGLPKLKYVDLRSHTFLDSKYTKEGLKILGWKRNKIIVLTNLTYEHQWTIRIALPF
uniref:F-box/LRR-repeat protein 15 n=1 Tax=Lygus hesperus TaxID=30085 RepID=A0A0A9WGT4_LYGHE